jgi:hypothetical protein
MTLLSYNKDRMTPYFWRRENRVDEVTGKALIYLRIEIVGKKRAEFSTGIKATEREWNQSIQRLQVVRGMTKAQVELQRQEQEHLDVLLSNLRMAYRVHLSQGGSPTPADLRELLRGRKRTTTDLSVLGAVRALIAALQAKGRQPSTIRDVQGTLRKMEEYLGQQRQLSLLMEQMDRPWARAFERWCLSQHLDPSSIRRFISHLKRSVDLAVDEGLIAANPLAGYRYLSEPVKKPKRHLSLEEIKRLQEYAQAARQSLARVADIFLFCCDTGLSYGDYIRFATNPTPFLVIQDGVLGIGMQRQKMLTRSQLGFWVPLFEYALFLYEKKYAGQLPTRERSHVAKTLKIIAADLKLSLPDLKHKDARSTFSQHMRDKYGRELAAGMAGHSEQVADGHYSSISPKRIVEQLNILGAPMGHN